MRMLVTLQDIFMTDECSTTEFLAVRKYGEISGKPLHFARYKYVLAVENMAKFSKNRHISDVMNISCKVDWHDVWTAMSSAQ
jgi:hypothetical protein